MASAGGAGPLRLIANPRAGRGRHAVLPVLRDALDRLGIAHDLALTACAGDAVELTRRALGDGVRCVVAVGGDGTVHEVVNGLVDPATGPRGAGLTLGVVPAGSGCDFARTFGLPRDPESLAAVLAGDRRRRLDVGTVSLLGADGAPRAVCFANIAEVGYGAAVVDAAQRAPRWLGGTRYLYGVAAAVREFRLSPMHVTIDGQRFTGSYSNIVVANGRYFGGNMHVAPRARADSGVHDVQLWTGRTRDIVAMTGKIKRGRHLGDARVTNLAGREISVECERPLLVEADGEVLGSTAATFGILPGALELKV